MKKALFWLKIIIVVSVCVNGFATAFYIDATEEFKASIIYPYLVHIVFATLIFSVISVYAIGIILSDKNVKQLERLDKIELELNVEKEKWKQATDKLLAELMEE